MCYTFPRTKSWPVCIFTLAATASITGCGVYVVDEFGGLIAENLSPAVANSCGPSGPLELLIPDCPAGLVCFSAACERHDVCYGTCGASRTVCDAQFFQDMVAICYAHLLGEDQELARCLVLAYVYWDAVHLFGGEAFDGTQGLLCSERRGERNERTTGKLNPAESPGNPPFDDADRDLIPDEWEVSVGLNPGNPSDALQDFDADGLVNLQEFIHDTDPFNPDSNSVDGGG